MTLPSFGMMCSIGQLTSVHPFLSLFIYFLLPSPSHGVLSFLEFENLFAILSCARFSSTPFLSSVFYIIYIYIYIVYNIYTGMVLIDLQKAFDTIDHGILLDKMNCLGFSNSTVVWIKSCLTNRSFIVNVGKEYSSLGKLFFGVPQGSILGPLLFLLYANDMPQACCFRVIIIRR